MGVTTAEAVLKFWFEDLDPKSWYISTGALDEKIRAKFEDTWRAARAGQLDSWMLKPESALALLLVLDQFPGICSGAMTGPFPVMKRRW